MLRQARKEMQPSGTEAKGREEQEETEEFGFWKRSRGTTAYRIQTSVILGEEVLAQKQRGSVESKGDG